MLGWVQPPCLEVSLLWVGFHPHGPLGGLILPEVVHSGPGFEKWGPGQDSTQRAPGQPSLRWPPPEVPSVGRANPHILPDSDITVQRHFWPKTKYPEC